MLALSHFKIKTLHVAWQMNEIYIMIADSTGFLKDILLSEPETGKSNMLRTHFYPRFA